MLKDLVLRRIPEETNHPQRLYCLAEACLSDPKLGWHICRGIEAILHHLSIGPKAGPGEVDHNSAPEALEERSSRVIAYLEFLKTMYWLPREQNHYATPNLVQILCNLIGFEKLDAPAHGVLSALLSLIRSPSVILISPEDPTLSTSHSGLIDQQLWAQLRRMDHDYFSAQSSRAFRTWFQWVTYADSHRVDMEGIYESWYWLRLRTGLVSGYAEQRKYCLGIIQRSLWLAQRDINMLQMILHVDQRSEYLRQYEKYRSLFETIVLDRYPNQIQACLPELSALLGSNSLISPAWTTALLEAALDSKVQDGVRKLVGAWYIHHVTEESGAIQTHAQFFVNGFLPWATQGSLFTTSLVSTRGTTSCAHGAALKSVVVKFVTAMPTASESWDLIVDILRFVLERDGRMFAYSILYLLEGTIQGLEDTGIQDLTPEVIVHIVRVSRLPGLPEIASDLCTTYCALICHRSSSRAPPAKTVPGYNDLKSRYQKLQATSDMNTNTIGTHDLVSGLFTGDTLQHTLRNLEKLKYRQIQGEAFVHACDEAVRFLDRLDTAAIQSADLRSLLEAFWEEADRQEYRRPVAIKASSLFFHPNCVEMCVREHRSEQYVDGTAPLAGLLATVMLRLYQLAEGRPYLLASLIVALRRACFANAKILSILPYEDMLVRFIERPPLPKKEFLFEIASVEKLQEYLPHRTYESYYGKREWHANAAVIDILSRFPHSELEVAKNILRRLLVPWRTQKKPVPIVSKWKETLQLQAMLLLSDFCIEEADAGWYLFLFMKALQVEQWPRYRHLLEWILSRIYYRFPKLTDSMLSELAKLSDVVPIYIASMMKLCVLAAPFVDMEDYALQLMTQLIPFSASSKVHIRHEAHWAVPMIWDLAEQRNWISITGNPAFRALNDHIRTLDKFNAPAWSIRTLRLDVVRDFNLAQIFQGDYLTIETPERELVTHEDFTELWKTDEDEGVKLPSARIPHGLPRKSTTLPVAAPKPLVTAIDTDSQVTSVSAPLQTKSGFDLASLLPPSGPPSTSSSQNRPASVILIASLIDNPTNLGGLSRIGESFGLEALYINSLAHLSSKDFQSTAVTSHKHLPIHELKIEAVPAFLIDTKRRGYEVVAVEQTDRSGVLGEEAQSKSLIGEEGDADFTPSAGMLPRKCVLVLGSEKGGVTPEVLAVVDRCVEIKTVGVTRSLNVQTAGGIAVYEWWREWGSKV
jgi:tRNA guanosine-2'-O-methyltransferase